MRDTGIMQGMHTTVRDKTVFRFTGKERDEETGPYYHAARYLDPRTGRWLFAGPAMGEYVPGVPVNDEVRKRNRNLPGMGGVFNLVNLHTYHYAGNNPAKYRDVTKRRFFPKETQEKYGELTIINRTR
jgi:RHS repeat-associated protein